MGISYKVQGSFFKKIKLMEYFMRVNVLRDLDNQ